MKKTEPTNKKVAQAIRDLRRKMTAQHEEGLAYAREKLGEEKSFLQTRHKRGLADLFSLADGSSVFVSTRRQEAPYGFDVITEAQVFLVPDDMRDGLESGGVKFTEVLKILRVQTT